MIILQFDGLEDLAEALYLSDAGARLMAAVSAREVAVAPSWDELDGAAQRHWRKLAERLVVLYRATS